MLKYTNPKINHSKTVDELVTNIILYKSGFDEDISEQLACRYLSVHCLSILERILKRRDNIPSKYDLMIINSITTKENNVAYDQLIIDLFKNRKE